MKSVFVGRLQRDLQKAMGPRLKLLIQEFQTSLIRLTPFKFEPWPKLKTLKNSKSSRSLRTTKTLDRFETKEISSIESLDSEVNLGIQSIVDRRNDQYPKCSKSVLLLCFLNDFLKACFRFKLLTN